MIATSEISAKIAKELILAAEDLTTEAVTAKKEVPEAFKKQWKNKDKDGDGKENEPKPDFLKDKEDKKASDGPRVRLTAKTAETKRAAEDYPYAAIVFKKTYVKFQIALGGGERGPSGTEPYRQNVPAAISKVMKVLKDNKVSDENIEVIA